MKIKVKDIKGIYTNRDETQLSAAYNKIVYGNIQSTNLESKDYHSTDLITSEVDYFGEIVVDEDKWKLQPVNGKYKNLYEYNPHYYYAIAKNNELFLYDSISLKTATYNFNFEGTFKQLINNDGISYLLTDTKFYRLMQYNRKNRYENLVNELKLEELLPQEFNLTSTVEKVGNVSKTINWIAQRSTEYTSTKELFYIINTETNEIVTTLTYHIDTINGCWIRVEGYSEFLNYRYLLNDYPTLESLDGKTGVSTKTYNYTINSGFSRGNVNLYYLFTVVLDSGDEIPIDEGLNSEEATTDYYGVKLTVNNIATISERVLNYRLYIKFKKDDNYELLIDNSLYTLDDVIDTVGKIDLKGITSYQTLGINSISDYKDNLVLNFDNFIFLGNTMFGIYANKVYYPVIGNGFTTFTFRDYIPNIEGNLLFSAKDKLGVATTNSIKFIHVETISNVFAFTLIDEVGWLIKDQYDIVETPDGVILNTSDGIMGLDVNQKVNLSTPIQNIIKEKWSVSNIAYDLTDNILIYFTDEYTYLFQFNEGIWRMSNIPSHSTNRLLRTNDGSLFLLYFVGEIEKYFIYMIKFISTPAYIQSNRINLTELGRRFKLTSISFDFEGTLSYHDKTVTNTERKPTQFVIPLAERRYNDYLEFSFVLENGILYNYEINFDIERVIEENTTQYQV